MNIRYARLASLRVLQFQTQEELDALLPSVLRPQATGGRAFQGALPAPEEPPNNIEP